MKLKKYFGSLKPQYGNFMWHITEPWQWVRYGLTGRRSRPRNKEDEFVPLRRHNWVCWDEVAEDQEKS